MPGARQAGNPWSFGSEIVAAAWDAAAAVGRRAAAEIRKPIKSFNGKSERFRQAESRAERSSCYAEARK